jgi:putative DNA primase/helicase
MTATARPLALEVNPDGIPAVLKARAQWVGWEYEWRGGKWTKTPLDIRTGALASSTDPATWATFEAALKAFNGRGYAGTIVMEMGSYTEVTPGGRGLHIIALAGLAGGKGRKSVKHGVEIYDRARFFTITGRALNGSPREPQPRQPELDDLYARLFPVRPVEDAPPSRPGTPPSDDRALIDRAHRARNGAAFARLWRGDISGHRDDESSADLALCNHLAFWTGPDPARIDRLFRVGGLYRTKWERQDYRDATIAKALEGRTDFYGWDERGGDGEDDGATFSADEADEADEAEDGPAGERPAAPANPADYDQTDTGNARLFAALYAGELRHDWRRLLWHRWAGHWWEIDSDGQATHRTETIGTLRLRAAAEVEDKDEKKQALRFAYASQSGKARETLLRLARAEPALRTDGTAWDGDPFLLGVANGVVDLTTGRLHAGRPADLITLHTPVPYDPDAAAPRWEQFLREVFRDDPALIAYVRRFAGYSLTGDTGEHKLLICWGKGANGKSTLLNTLAHVAGEYGYAMPFSTLESQRQAGGPTNDLAALVGRRLVTSSEVNEGQPLNEARIKALTGGDPITARFLNREFFTFRPAAKFWLAVNHKPTVRDDSRGLWRRIDMLPFVAAFDGDAANKHLEADLRAEASGILAWCVRGCLEWRADGLGQPAIVTDATREYQRESDPVAPFIAACCLEGSQQIVRANVLYLAYLDWTAQEGLREREILSRQRFGRLLGDRYDKGHDRQGAYYKGLGVDTTWQDAAKRGARFTP